MNRSTFLKSLTAIGVLGMFPKVPFAHKCVFDKDAVDYLKRIGVPNDETVYMFGKAETTGATIWKATNQFFLSMKSKGYYDKAKSFYLFIGTPKV